MTKFLKSNKKSQARIYFGVIVFLLIFGFVNIMGALLLTNFLNEFGASSFSSDITTKTGEKFLKALLLTDKIMVILIFVFVLSVGITTYKLATAPVFFLINFIMAAFYGFVSYFFNILFQQMVSETIFSAIIISFPATLLICTNLHWVMLALIVVGSITLYAKREKGQFV